MYDKTSPTRQCYLQQFIAFAGSADVGTTTPMVFCNTHDRSWKPSTAVISEARWAGGENVGAGSVTYSLRDPNTGTVVAQATSRLALGLYPPLTGGHPLEIPFPIDRPGSYVMSMNYSGATEYLVHMHGGGPPHNVTVNWQPSSSPGVPIRIAECGDDPVVKKVGGKRPVLRVSVSDCLLPEFKDQFRYEWVVFGGRSGSERLTPAGDMSGCSITVPQMVGGKKVSRIEVTRSTFAGARRTTRSALVSKPACSLPADIREVNWETMPASVQQDVRRAMLAEWRQQNPADTTRGSAEAFRAFADSVDLMLTLGWLNGSVQNVDANAVWQALLRAPEELGNLPEYACLTASMVAGDPFGTYEQANRAALALLDGVLSGAVDTAKAGVSLAALMTYERPLSLAESLSWWTQQSPRELLLQARAAGISVSDETAKQFIATAEQINNAALRGDDAQIATLIGNIGGRAVWDELFALGSVKGLTAASKAARPAIAKVEKALEGARERFAKSASKVYRQSAGEVSVRELQQLGMDDFTASHFTVVAEEEGVRIGVKASDEVGGLKVARGDYLAKPEGLGAANSITPEDIALGLNAGDRGAVYWGPVAPPAPGASAAVVKRFEERTKAFADPRNKAIMEYLQKDPSTRGPVPGGMREAYGDRYQYGRVEQLHIKIENGIVKDAVTGKPFGPDPDGMVIFDKETNQMAAPATVDRVTKRLFPVGIQHGFTAHSGVISDETRRRILQTSGGGVLSQTPMILLGGRGPNALPVRGVINYTDSDAWRLAHPDYKGL